MRPRVSIRRLLAVVAIFAVGFAALAAPTDLRASCLFTLALASFGLACLGAASLAGQAVPALQGWRPSAGAISCWPSAPGFVPKSGPTS